MKNKAIEKMVKCQYDIGDDINVIVTFTHLDVVSPQKTNYFYNVEWWDVDEQGNDVQFKTSIQISSSELKIKQY